jgi:hypothetical protein
MRLDRLARSTKQLYEIHEDLEQRGVNFVSAFQSIGLMKLKMAVKKVGDLCEKIRFRAGSSKPDLF